MNEADSEGLLGVRGRCGEQGTDEEGRAGSETLGQAHQWPTSPESTATGIWRLRTGALDERMTANPYSYKKLPSTPWRIPLSRQKPSRRSPPSRPSPWLERTTRQPGKPKLASSRQRCSKARRRKWKRKTRWRWMGWRIFQLRLELIVAVRERRRSSRQPRQVDVNFAITDRTEARRGDLDPSSKRFPSSSSIIASLIKQCMSAHSQYRTLVMAGDPHYRWRFDLRLSSLGPHLPRPVVLEKHIRVAG